ncbi:response regulator [Melioribacteraceae bacterium 4301-Me]|uniref:response regulator n=1 Tax=Pyranulibacter aquaticus TaxID=3163344 RepID=UPI00359ABA5F
MNIVITDDHEIIREGLKKIFAKYSDLNIVAEASDVKELAIALQNNPTDLIILDVSLPSKSGLDFIKDIRQKFPEIKILVFSIFPEEKFAKRAIDMGADGYLSKNAKPSEIISAIRKIESGGKYIKSELLEKIFLYSPKNNTEKAHEILSDREFEVLRLLAKGNKLTQIAELLGLSVNTIASYKSRIQEKLNIKSTAELIRYAIDNDLVEKY